MNCSEGMVYQQCGPACPKTCNDDDNVDCPSGCVEGCFCPTGMVLSNGQCINESDCEGTVKLILYMHTRGGSRVWKGGAFC